MAFTNNFYNDSRLGDNSAGAMLQRANLKDTAVGCDKPFASRTTLAVNIDIVEHRLHKERQDNPVASPRQLLVPALSLLHLRHILPIHLNTPTNLHEHLPSLNDPTQLFHFHKVDKMCAIR